MSLSSRLGFGLALSLAALSAYVFISPIYRDSENPMSHRSRVKTVGSWQTTPTETIATATDLMSLSEDGQRLATISTDGANLEVWNTQANSLLVKAVVDGPNSTFSAVAISRDGTQLAAIKSIWPAGEQQLIVRAVEDGRILLNKPLNPPQLPPPKKDYITEPFPTDIAFSPDGKEAITQSALSTTPPSERFGNTIYNSLSFHDIKTGEVTQSIDLLGVDDNMPKGYMVSSDGSLLASLSSNSTTIPDFGVITHVNIWQRNEDNRFDYLTTLPLSEDGAAVFDVAFTTSNQLNLITTSSLWNLTTNMTANKSTQARLETWNPQTAKRVLSTVLPMERCVAPESAVLSPDGTSYYSSYPDAGTCLGNVRTGEFQKLPNTPFAYKIVKFSGNGNRLAISNAVNSSSPNVQIFFKSKN